LIATSAEAHVAAAISTSLAYGENSAGYPFPKSCGDVPTVRTAGTIGTSTWPAGKITQQNPFQLLAAIGADREKLAPRAVPSIRPGEILPRYVL
jgi:hypothetical protein